ncbi:hypothetical protein PRUPE_8G132200 [Prunus persica]|uniref:NB-ARC domain-containing protein n=1 Tax=Prunus persica TaxID=3760 RepID=A0A251MX84_PRUPE|nr:hypothetical protein PRUPE_8G132200 [Prunus persica]
MSMRFSRDCDACDGDGQCEFCSVEFHLRAKCYSDQTLDVTSKDLLSSDHTVVPVERDYHCEVAKGARAESSAATVTFMYEPDIQINEELMDMLTLDEKKAWVESSPAKVFDFDPKTEKGTLIEWCPRLQRTFHWLVPLLREEGNLLRGIHDEITSIKDLLESMISFLKDADAKVERATMSSGVKTWVKQTREMGTHIEDVIDEYLRHVARHRNKHGFSGFILITNHFVRGLIARHEIASEIQLIKKRVLQIQQTSEAYRLNSTEQTSFSSSRRDDMLFDPRMASFYTNELVGIQTLRDKLIGWSIGGEVESRHSVSSLVGIGGLGKTTLAKKVFDNPKLTEWFDWRPWITVSQSYKNEGILRNLVEFCNHVSEYVFVLV